MEIYHTLQKQIMDHERSQKDKKFDRINRIDSLSRKGKVVDRFSPVPPRDRAYGLVA
jgi:hypothetical protein